MLPIRLAAVAVLAWFAAGCSAIDNAPINVAMTSPAAAAEADAEPPVFGETAIALSFSGGGTRAAAFAHGVLQGLAAQPAGDGSGDRLVDRVVFVSGVSGGSVAAAYLAYRGPDAVTDFRERFLVQDVEASLRTGINPANLLRAFEGGVNDRRGLPTWLDNNLFGGATFGDIRGPHRPVLWVNASDIYNRNVFIFDESTFSVICSDLSSYPLSEAVAASAAVPIAFAPVLIKNFADRCSYAPPDWAVEALQDGSATSTVRAYAHALQRYREPDQLPVISLVDGGITDNLGVYGVTMARATAETPYAPMTAESAVRARNLLFVVVDAGRGPAGDWPRRPGGPSGAQVAEATVDTMIDANIRYTYDAFHETMEAWRQDLISYRCGLSANEVQRLRGTTGGWNCRDLDVQVVRVAFDGAEPDLHARLNAVRTRFSLPDEEVDLVIGAGRSLLETNAGYRAFLDGID